MTSTPTITTKFWILSTVVNFVSYNRELSITIGCSSIRDSFDSKYPYRNDPKFSDKLVRENSVDPDQTALDQGLQYLQYCLHLLDALLYGKTSFFEFKGDNTKILGVQKFRNITVHTLETSVSFFETSSSSSFNFLTCLLAFTAAASRLATHTKA